MDLFRCQDKTTAIAEPRPIPDCATVVCITSASIIMDLLPIIIIYVFPDNTKHDTEKTNFEKKNVANTFLDISIMPKTGHAIFFVIPA